MAIVISGVNNNDKITASDGTIDLLSGVNLTGILTAPSFSATGNISAASINVGSNIQLGNAGVATATTFVGNLTGNVNNTGNLLLQIGGSEKFRVGGSGQLGIGGANYGTPGQVLTSGGSGSAATWSTINSDAINEGNTKAEVIDSGSDGRFIVETDGVQRIRIDSNGLGITSTTTAARNAGVGTAIGTIIFNSTENKLQLYANDLNWRGFSPADPTISSISGTLYAGAASTLSLTGSNFLQSNLQVRFVQNTRSVDVTVTVTPSSETSASVTVPATVYNNIQGSDVVSITVTNSDGVVSNTVTKTAVGLPTGGNITTSGSYRIHTFTSNGDFVVPTGTTLTNVEYLVVGGGGGGGPSNQGHQGGGGGRGQNDGASRGGLNGGCGGGAASSDQSIASPGSGTAGQGYDGGQPTCVGCGQGGAGGGAGGSGSVGGSGGVGSNNTPGGAGLVNNITGSNVTYATGGDCPGTSGTNQNPGADNTGNGGDGGYSHMNSSTGQAGGSGIVIVRYQL